MRAMNGNPKAEIRNPKEARRPKSEWLGRSERVGGDWEDRPMFNEDGLDLPWTIGLHTPHPGPLPVEGRGSRGAGPQALAEACPRVGIALPLRRSSQSIAQDSVARAPRVTLSPRRGEGRGEGCDAAEALRTAQCHNRPSGFGFLSDFGFRISDFARP